MPTNYCRHIRPSGRRCQMRSLRNKPFCYYHESVNAHLRTLHPPDDGTTNIIHPMNLSADKFQREPILAEYFAQTRGPLELHFPTLEDADAIQLSLSMLLTALGQNRIDMKRASGMVYTLQVAAANVRNTTQNATHTVTEVLTDDSGNLMSADEDPEEVIEAQQLLEEIEEELEQEKEDDEDEDEAYDDNDKEQRRKRIAYTKYLFYKNADADAATLPSEDSIAPTHTP
jgi:hypothetical protein